MPYENNGKTLESDANGYLVNMEDWNEEVAAVIAQAEGIGELTQKHWDLINYQRSEYFDNNEQPMERAINKGMSKVWGKKVTSKDLYVLFPLAPSKQGNKIAGLPYVARKGGY